MTLEEFENLQLNQEVFFIKKVRINDHMTFSCGVNRFAVQEQRIHNKKSDQNKVGDIWWVIKGANGCKGAYRALVLNDLNEWYIDRDEALYAKLRFMDRAIKNCNILFVKRQLARKYNKLIQQKNVLKIAEIYPEFFI